jgi:molybdopterin molybdotransferase
MLTVDQALQAVLERVGPLPPTSRSLAEALDCILAEDVAADLDSPPFDKSLVDGYAVRVADLASGERRLRLGEEITAGKVPSRPLAEREAALVMTGAPLPPGADAVVMLEQVRREGSMIIIDDDPVTPGQFWLPQGREMRAGEIVLRRGERLNPVRLGLLASVGRSKVRVIPRPEVVIVPTGDELVEPERRPGPGQIRNSNATMLQALASTRGARAEATPIVGDDPEALHQALQRGLTSDLLLITGGVSVGTHDLVPAALEALGVAKVFHKVKIKPGKPLWFGLGPRREDRPGTLVFGLPGNPVSGIVGFLVFVRPALDALWGHAPGQAPLSRGRLTAPFFHRGERTTYHPARWYPEESAPGASSEPSIEPLEWAGSADLRPVALADGFAVFPAGDRNYEQGEIIEFLPLGER